MIYKQVYNTGALLDEFAAYNRGDQFSYDGFEWLFDTLDETECELDVIGICCDFTEYEPDEFVKEISEEHRDEFTELSNGNFIGWNI